MLYKEAVESATLELIRKIQADKPFNNFFLVGGTSLALQIGHRKSDDIDLFSEDTFEIDKIVGFLESNYEFQLLYSEVNTVKGIINNVFIDIMTHSYPLIEKPFLKEGIRLISMPDISAMKMNAISGNGTRIKDFIDIYFLLKYYTFGDLISFFSQKYGKRNEFHALKSITYFEDVDTKSWPVMLLEKRLTFNQVKKRLNDSRNDYLKGLNQEIGTC